VRIGDSRWEFTDSRFSEMNITKVLSWDSQPDGTPVVTWMGNPVWKGKVKA
jgi:hypothetical protein